GCPVDIRQDDAAVGGGSAGGRRRLAHGEFPAEGDAGSLSPHRRTKPGQDAPKGDVVSQLFTYFVCSRPLIERGVDALGAAGEGRQAEVEAEMPRVLTLGVSQPEVNLLARCLEGGPVRAAAAARGLDLVRALSEEEGPWVMAFRRPAIHALAGMSV